MTIFEILGILAGIAQAAGYVWYLYHVIKKDIKPNVGSWLIWSYGNTILCWNYISLDTFSFKDSLPFICSVLCIFLAILFVFLHKFEKPSVKEIILLLVDIGITIYWLLSGESLFLQLLLHISVAISFYPIIDATKKDPTIERSVPWKLWSIAYLLLFFAQINSDWILLIYPIHYLFWDVLMVILAKKSKPSVSY